MGRKWLIQGGFKRGAICRLQDRRALRRLLRQRPRAPGPRQARQRSQPRLQGGGCGEHHRIDGAADSAVVFIQAMETPGKPGVYLVLADLSRHQSGLVIVGDTCNRICHAVFEMTDR